MNIKFHQLNIYSAVMRFGSVTRAAEMLNMTQPNVSKTIRDIEDQIGIKLFQRIGGRLTPTPEAWILSAEAEKLHSEVKIFNKVASELQIKSTGVLKIAALAAFSTQLIPETLAEFNKSFPDVEVTINITNVNRIHEAVSRRHVDIGIIHSPEFEVEKTTTFDKIITHPLICIAPPDHRFKEFKSVSAADLDDETFISYPDNLPFRAIIQNSLIAAGSTKTPTMVANHTCLVLRMVKQGIGVAIVDSFSITKDDPELLIRPFDQAPSVSIGILTPFDHPKSMLTKAYLEILHDVVQGSPKP